MQRLRASIITGKTTTGIVEARWWVHAQESGRAGSPVRCRQSRRIIGHRGRAALSGLDATLTPDDVARDHFRIFAKT
jgi:hypothetical protein